MKRDAIKLVYLLILTSLGYVLPAASIAQQEYPRLIKRIPADTDLIKIEDALRIGDFIIKPRIGFTEYYDNNIYATADNEEGDSISVFKAAAALDSDWENHALNFDIGFDAARYAEFDTENTVDTRLGARGEYDFTQNTQIFAELRSVSDHEDRASPDEIYGIEPVEFTENNLNIGYLQKVDAHLLTLAINNTEYNFDDVNTATGVIDNDTRDHTIATYGLRFNYALNKGYYLFIQGISDNRDYEQAFDLNGFNRDSDGSVITLGFKFNRSTLLQGEVYAGLLKQQFDDAQFDEVSEADFGAQVRWFTGPNSILNLVIDRTLEETTLNGASSFLYTLYGLRVDQRLTSQWFCNINASHGEADYQMLAREDIYKDYGFGVSFAFFEGLSFDADVRHQQRDSSESTDDYRRNQIMLSVSARL
ncbi:MAG: hypothetical protein EP315_04300 [Gammaproteobacteria bacterium]|nr:MAG: hypothetical protein EP315_04300 [Gammaproteobacteria bacterium]